MISAATRKVRPAESAARSERLRWVRRKGCRESIQAQLAIQIAASPSVKFIESGNRAENPTRIHRLGKQFQFFGERNIAKNGFFDVGRELEEIGEQTMEDADLFFEGGLAVFGESRSVREKLREPLAACGTLQDAKSILPVLRGRIHVHFHCQAGAALGELRGQFDFRGLAIRFVLENFLDRGLRQGREMKLQATGDDG